MPNLCLTRGPNQWIRIGRDITITVTSVHGRKVKFSINAPLDVPIVRGELLDRHQPTDLETTNGGLD